MNTCKTCRFWDDLEGGEGLCRRYAPRPLTQKIHSELAWWPHTSADEWCGEHRAVLQDVDVRKLFEGTRP